MGSEMCIRDSNLLVCEDGWKVASMTDIELLQHSITPADVLFVTLATLEVLGCQGVEALHGEYLPHGLVDAAGRQALAVAGGLQT